MIEAAPCLPTVTVAISTLGVRFERIHLPEPKAGLDYLILVQTPQNVPTEGARELLKGRCDVSLIELSDLGLSNSRNAGLERAGGDLVLFSDDDVTLDVDGILALRDHFVADPELVLVAGWRAERMPSTARTQRLTRFNSGRICAPEFMIHKTKVKVLGVWFDPEFGLGARHGLGEDYVFVADIMSAGGRGLTVPVVTGSHPHTSTGELWGDPALMAARRAVIQRVFGILTYPIWVAYLLRQVCRTRAK